MLQIKSGSPHFFQKKPDNQDGYKLVVMSLALTHVTWCKGKALMILFCTVNSLVTDYLFTYLLFLATVYNQVQHNEGTALDFENEGGGGK